MRQTIKQMLGVLLIIIGSHLSLLADDFNPTNPAEPNPPVEPEVSVPVVYHKVTVNASPAGSVSSLSGAGSYKTGTSVRLSSSRYSSAYVFSHWEKDGEWYSNASSFYYTVADTSATFTVHYIYSPTSPGEPEVPKFEDKHRFYFAAEPLTAGYFSMSSGQEYLYEQTITVRATPYENYSFLGWYEGVKLVSTNPSFSFNMPGRDVTLKAKFVYDPKDPFEPSLPEGEEQEDIQTYPSGDADGDGSLNVADAVRVINMYLNGDYDVKADADADGKVDIGDAVIIINAYLKK